MHDGPDRGQVSAVGVRHRIARRGTGSRRLTVAVRCRVRLTAERFSRRRRAPRGRAIPGHQHTRYTGAENGPRGRSSYLPRQNAWHIGSPAHVYSPGKGYRRERFQLAAFSRGATRPAFGGRQASRWACPADMADHRGHRGGPAGLLRSAGGQLRRHRHYHRDDCGRPAQLRGRESEGFLPFAVSQQLIHAFLI